MGGCLGKKSAKNETDSSQQNTQNLQKISKHSLHQNPEFKNLQAKTSFTTEELEDWFHMFTEDYPLGYVTVDDFKKEYKIAFPNGEVDKFADLMFKAYDKNGDGTISYQEFIIGLNMNRKASVEEKLKWAFNFMDKDKDGILTKAEMLEVFNAFDIMSTKKKPQQPRQRVDSFFDHLGEENPDGMTIQKFVAVVQKDPNLVKEVSSLISCSASE